MTFYYIFLPKPNFIQDEMKSNLTNIFTSIVLDSQFHIIEVNSHNDKLLFGKQPEELINKSLPILTEIISKENGIQISLLFDALQRSQHESRNVYTEYTSFTSDGKPAHVGVHIVNEENTVFTLLITEIQHNDWLLTHSCTPNMEDHICVPKEIAEGPLSIETLNKRKLKTKLAMKTGDVMLWEFDTRTKLFICENSGFDQSNELEIFTIEDFLKILHPDDIPATREIIKSMLKGCHEAYNAELRIMFPDNPEWQYCTFSGSSFEKDANGKIIKYVGFRKNNTELVKKKLLQEKILNSIPLPILIKDIEDNSRFVFCNEESLKIFGNLIDTDLRDLVDDQQIDRIKKSDLEVFRTGETYFGKERIIFRNGKVYDNIVRKSIINDNGKRLLLDVRWDRSVQNELERREKILSISMEALNAYTWYYEPAIDKITYGEGFDKTGRDAGMLNNLVNFTRHIHADDQQKFLHAIEKTLQQDRGNFLIEYRINKEGNKQNEWRECRGILETIIRDDGPHKFMFGMDINIDSHKQAELALLKNKERMLLLIQQNELVMNNTNSGLAFIDTNYIVQWENVSICSASLSYEAYKKGEPCYKSAHNRTSPCEDCVMQRAMRSKQVEQITFRLNNERTVEVFATPVCNEDNKVEGIVIRVDDVTEREQMIEELRRAKAMAEQSDKLKSAFLANMSHEIRTPLNAIVGFSELLMTATEPEEKEEFMKIIATNNDLLLKLINDILDLSKIEAGAVELAYEDFDLSEYFDEIASSMKQRINKPNVRFSSINPYISCRVVLDKNRVTQILTNYVTNAIKYTPKGFVEMGYELVNEGIRLYVNDSGIGIADDKKNKVFQRFEKLDEFAQGTGLGLSICKAIAESMGGSVGFESSFGEGSEFWAILPCLPNARSLKDLNKQNEPTDTSGNEITVAPGKRKIILVAEDIESNYMLVEALLRKNYELFHALNGHEAVEIVKKHHVDLLLMDMKMPVMDGMQATAEIRKFNNDLPIVALTAHAFETDRLAALQNGCNDYLIKPVNRSKLIEVIEKHC